VSVLRDATGNIAGFTDRILLLPGWLVLLLVFASAAAFVFAAGVTLGGNCPLLNIATTNPLQYRFTFGEWTWTPPGDDPTTMPSVAPGSLAEREDADRGDSRRLGLLHGREQRAASPRTWSSNRATPTRTDGSSFRARR